MGNIKVLWMNNGDERLKIYRDKALLKGFEITLCANMTECRGQLANHNHKKWDAVILNACPKMTDSEIPTETNLHSAYAFDNMRNGYGFIKSPHRYSSSVRSYDYSSPRDYRDTVA